MSSKKISIATLQNILFSQKSEKKYVMSYEIIHSKHIISNTNFQGKHEYFYINSNNNNIYVNTMHCVFIEIQIIIIH